MACFREVSLTSFAFAELILYFEYEVGAGHNLHFLAECLAVGPRLTLTFAAKKCQNIQQQQHRQSPMFIKGEALFLLQRSKCRLEVNATNVERTLVHVVC